MSGMRSYFQVSMSIARDGRMVHAMRAVGDSALALWLFGLAWSRSELTDGVIPAYMLPVIHPLSSRAVEEVADALVAAGLWRRRDDGSYEIAGYSTWNPLRDTVESKLEKDRGRKAAGKDPTRIPRGIQTESKGSGDGFRVEEKRREERGERKEERKEVKQKRAPAHEPADCAQETPALPAPQATANPDAAKILDRIRTHPELAPIASVALAERLASLRLTGKTLEAILLSVDELADKATAAALAGAPWNAEHMGGRALAFGRNASGPRPRGRDSPKVQTGETDWSKEADVVGGSEANR